MPPALKRFVHLSMFRGFIIVLAEGGRAGGGRSWRMRTWNAPPLASPSDSDVACCCAGCGDPVEFVPDDLATGVHRMRSCSLRLVR